MSDRDEVVKAIVAEVPISRILVAAAQIMVHEGLIPEGRVEKDAVADWISTLDTDQLLKLRRVAEGLETAAK